jgi:pimeloyl-ACP methyl ester carboxylesterase
MSQLTAPILTVEGATGTTYAYRRFGPADGPPVVFLQCFRGNLDLWDPILIDTIAAEHDVIMVDASGVGRSTGDTPRTVPDYATDIMTFIAALGLDTVDLFGFSMGGFVAQEIALRRPYLVRRLILAGTGPEGGRGMHTWSPDLRSHLFKDEQDGEDLLALFFAPSETSRAKGTAYIERIFSRTSDADDPTSPATRDAQVDVIAGWGIPDASRLARLQGLRLPTLVANGDHDIVVPTPNSFLLAGHIPDAEMVLYPDAAHGAPFQYPGEFGRRVNEFLAAKDERRPELTTL